MATYTSNLNLKKPALDDDALITDINNNMDILDAAANGIEDALAIVANGNTHAAITSGQFVYVRNHNTLTEGLYVASSNIAANATLSSSNLTADSKGGLNALSEQMANLIKSKTFSVTTDSGGNVDINTSNLGYMRNKCLLLAIVTDVASGDIVFPQIGVYRASTASWTVKFVQGTTPMASQTFNITVWYVLI